jgi:hypothetical protein
VVGHTLPRAAHVSDVKLDGTSTSDYTARLTNRGLELTVATTPGQVHTLTVTTG